MRNEKALAFDGFGPPPGIQIALLEIMLMIIIRR